MQEIKLLEKNELIAAFQRPFLNALNKEIENQRVLLDNTDKVFHGFFRRLERIDGKNQNIKCINESDWLKAQLFDLLEKEFPQKREVLYTEEFADFIAASDSFLKELPIELEKEQSIERFENQVNDTSAVKVRKFFKRLGFQTSTIPKRTANLFRSQKAPIQRWSQKIPYRSIAHYHFRQQFALHGLTLFEELQRIKCAALNLIIQIDRDIEVEFQNYLDQDDFDLKAFTKQIENLSEKNKLLDLKRTLAEKIKIWQDSSEQKFTELYDQFQEALAKVDTFELSRNNFSQAIIDQQRLLLTNSYNRIFHGWRNTFFAQIDDFQVDLELYLIKNVCLKQYLLLKSSCRSRMSATIEGHINPINDLFTSLKEKFDSTQFMKLSDVVSKQKLLIVNKLEKEFVPNAIDAIYNQNLVELLSRLEVKVKEVIDKMRTKRIIYSNNQYDAPIGKSELSHFNPKELVILDVYPELNKQIGELQSSIIKEVEDVMAYLRDLAGIVNYNLEATVNLIGEGVGEEDVRKTYKDGIGRITSKIEESIIELQEVEFVINSQLDPIIEQFNQKITSLTVNENVTKIRLKIAKAKAVEKTEEYKRNLINNFKTFLPRAYQFIKAELLSGKRLFDKGLRKVGLVEEDYILTSELSDYLSKNDKSIENLPYVYKKLFQIKALEDDLFFEGRVEELNFIKQAFEKWKSGSYSSTLLHGEKGSGASTLINIFSKDLQGVDVYRKKLDEGIYSKDRAFQFLNEWFNKMEINSFEQAVDFLNSGKKKVLILEDFQHFYLKKINGFEAMNMLLELISNTSQNVFWIIEITSYTYSYLSKTIDISRYFRFNIELKIFSKQSIVSLIMKRHRVSGYKLNFTTNYFSQAERKKIKSLSKDKQQEGIREIYFGHLNQFAQSNISLALIYWLRSIDKIENNTINITRNQPFNFEFLNTMNDENTFTLHSLLLHDSLNVEEHAAVFHQSISSSRRNLMVLVDNGLLSVRQNRYYLNRLLYRYVVNALISKNIIH